MFRDFYKGNCPDAWCLSVISPIHNKGFVSDPNHFRGILLIDSLGKIVSYILYMRLTKRSENHNVTDELQAGFRNNHSTIDNIIVLQALIQKICLSHVADLSAFSLTFKTRLIASSMANY